MKRCNMESDDIKDEKSLVNGCCKDLLGQNEMVPVTEKACSSSSIEVQGKFKQSRLEMDKQYLYKFSHIVYNHFFLPLFISSAGDIEENVADLGQGQSYDLLGNNLEGKFIFLLKIVSRISGFLWKCLSNQLHPQIIFF